MSTSPTLRDNAMPLAQIVEAHVPGAFDLHRAVATGHLASFYVCSILQ
jgi:hypothetical protein